MMFRWLKKLMPRGLYGRAALILILPVILLQLLISVVFIQRHFEGVTRSMTRAMSIDLRYVQDELSTAGSEAELVSRIDRLSNGLQLDIARPPGPQPDADIIPIQDLTGSTVISTFRDEVVDIQRVSFAQRREVKLWLGTGMGPVEVTFRRSRVSAANPHQLLVIMVVIGGLMTTIAYFFLRNQLRPIKRMADAANAYGKGRIVDFNPTGAIEVRAAGMAFLDMRNRIERQTQSRTLMLSGISHDLRTPLTRMRLGLSMMDEADAEHLIQDVDEMQHLLDGFLDFARSDAGDTLEPMNPTHLVQSVLDAAQRSGQNLTQGQIIGAPIEIAVRPLAIRRALDNLVGNALRYGTNACIGLTITDRAVRFTVEDDGPGIPVDQREEATRPFVRLDQARNQDAGSGVGLGLSIVSDIARSHGGMLRLEDSDLLGGLRAEFVLAR